MWGARGSAKVIVVLNLSDAAAALLLLRDDVRLAGLVGGRLDVSITISRKVGLLLPTPGTELRVAIVEPLLHGTKISTKLRAELPLNEIFLVVGDQVMLRPQLHGHGLHLLDRRIFLPRLIFDH